MTEAYLLQNAHDQHHIPCVDALCCWQCHRLFPLHAPQVQKSIHSIICQQCLQPVQSNADASTYTCTSCWRCAVCGMPAVGPAGSAAPGSSSALASSHSSDTESRAGCAYCGADNLTRPPALPIFAAECGHCSSVTQSKSILLRPYADPIHHDSTTRGRASHAAAAAAAAKGQYRLAHVASKCIPQLAIVGVKSAAMAWVDDLPAALAITACPDGVGPRWSHVPYRRPLFRTALPSGHQIGDVPTELCIALWPVSMVAQDLQLGTAYWVPGKHGPVPAQLRGDSASEVPPATHELSIHLPSMLETSPLEFAPCDELVQAWAGADWDAPSLRSASAEEHLPALVAMPVPLRPEPGTAVLGKLPPAYVEQASLHIPVRLAQDYAGRSQELEFEYVLPASAFCCVGGAAV